MLNVGNVGELPENIKIRQPLWPNNSRFGVCLTHDVDRVKKTYQYFTHSIKKRNLSQIFSFLKSIDEPYWQFENIRSIEEGYGVRSTFFFLNETIKFNPLNPGNWPFSLGRYDINSPKIKKVIRDLDKNGWEIGIHGSVRSYNDIKLLGQEKKVLEQILGHKISGGRQHWLNLKIPESWKIHQELGLKYDSTFGKKYGVGFRDKIFHPFSPFNNDFLVFPLAIMDSFLFSKCKSFEDAIIECDKVIEKARSENGLLTILWHQSTFNEEEFENYSKVYKYIIEKCLSDGAWIGTCEQAYNFITKKSG